jgi:hypothetical protein
MTDKRCLHFDTYELAKLLSEYDGTDDEDSFGGGRPWGSILLLNIEIVSMPILKNGKNGIHLAL